MAQNVSSEIKPLLNDKYKEISPFHSRSASGVMEDLSGESFNAKSLKELF